MGHEGETADLQQDQDAGDNECHSGDAGRDVDLGQGGRRHSEIPLSEQAGGFQEPAVEATSRFAERPTPQAVHSELPPEPMADHRHSNETALVEGIPPRPEGQGYDAAAEHGRIAMLIAKWELLNPANHCFANSSMLAMAWACLHRVHFATADWGALQLDSKPCCNRVQLLSYSWGLSNLETFLLTGMEPDSGMQLSSPPFLAHSCLWERRYARVTGVVKRHAHAMGAVPLHLRVMPDPQHSVFHLIENWEHDSGMIAAFTHLPPLLILHLDRLKPMAGLTYGQKLTSKVHLDSKFQVPQFRGDGIPTLHHDYVIVAAVAHLGLLWPTWGNLVLAL